MFYFDIAKHHLLAMVGATFPKCRVRVCTYDDLNLTGLLVQQRKADVQEES